MALLIVCARYTLFAKSCEQSLVYFHKDYSPEFGILSVRILYNAIEVSIEKGSNYMIYLCDYGICFDSNLNTFLGSKTVFYQI